MPRLANKTALITGGTSGIGLTTARLFLAEGARVAITGTDSDHLAEARRTLGGDVVTVRADAGNVVDQRTTAALVKDAFGKLDIAFLNAGIGDFRPLAAWDEVGFDRSISVNLKGPFFLVQALLPILSNPASIVLNGSINARIGMANSS